MTKRRGLYHPATLYLLLTLGVVFFSWIADIYGFGVTDPASGNEVHVQSLLSSEGLRWWLRHVVSNFTGFAPLGMVMVAMFGIGVAEYSGFLHACIRQGLRRGLGPKSVVWAVIFLGIVSNVVGDAGYILLIPVAAILFRAVGLHPLGGILVAYVTVACGFSANLFISTLDPLLARHTQEAIASSAFNPGPIGALSNYLFMFVSTFLLAGIIYRVTTAWLLPALGSYSPHFPEVQKQLSRKERRALLISLVTGSLFAGIVIVATFSPWGFLRGITGGMTRSPFIVGALFLISLGIGLMGMVYGFTSGRFRSDADVVKGLSQPVSLLAVYFVIAFFAAQMFACFEYSNLDECLVVWMAGLFPAVPPGKLPALVVLILLTAVINLIMVSSTSKWALMSFLFVPAFAAAGISPDWTQCAFRIGDSATNAVTPFLFYMPLVLAYMLHYDVRSDYFLLLRYTWRYSLFTLAGWTLLFVVWYLLGLPPGF